jgi:hypothetical protein
MQPTGTPTIPRSSPTQIGIKVLSMQYMSIQWTFSAQFSYDNKILSISYHETFFGACVPQAFGNFNYILC